MKKIISFILICAFLFSLASCEKIPDEAVYEDVSTDIIAIDTLPQTNPAEETTGEVVEKEEESTRPEETTAEETTAAPETTALANGWESIVHEEDGVQYIEGSSQLLGSPSTTDTEAVKEPEKPVMYPKVLMYHLILDEPYTQNTVLFVPPADFEDHLRVLQELNIETLFADEFGPCEKNSVILTFDDGYEDNYTNLFPLLKKYNMKATIYLIAYSIDKPGYLTSEQIKEMAASGLVRFGSHTLDHPSLTYLTNEAINEQLNGAHWIISQLTGQSVSTLAYPSGFYDKRVMEIAEKYYKFAFTTDSGIFSPWLHTHMNIPRIAVLRGCNKALFRTYVE